MSKTPTPSKNMRRILEAKKKHEKYLASEEYSIRMEKHQEWLDEHFPGTKKVEEYRPITTRKRRGKVVEIPEMWQGVVTYPQTIRKRNEIKRRTRKEK